MTPSAIADSIVNLCGAVGLAVAMLALDRRDPGGPFTRRLLFLLGAVAALFFIRGLAWWHESAWLDRLSLLPAATIPLGALIVTEGILRRHAPRPIKQIAVAGALLLGLGGALGLDAWSTAYAVALSTFQLAGFAACALLFALRDRNQLLASENRGIGRLAVGALLVIPFIVTDYRALAPDLPVRLGALGALLVVTAVLIAGGSGETRRQGIVLAALRISSAALLGAAAAFISDDVDAAQIMRFSAVAVAGVLTIGLMTDTLRAWFEAQAPGMLNAVAASSATTREQLLEELLRQPLFESARRFRELDLVAYDPPLLRDLLASRPVLRRADAPWGLAPVDPAVERVASLLAANSATHVVVLSHDPVDVFVLAVPVMLADPASETALALVRRLLTLTPERA
ncbi:hypothetical protein [Bradyrhizobium sp.]|uniref:hypothetical protein n=1 Tax=Bradyrhizobium sp. TaxID=376 RepID=UPI0040381FD1